MVLGYKPAKLRVIEALPVWPSRLTHAATESSNRPNTYHLPARPHQTPSTLLRVEKECKGMFLCSIAFHIESNIFFNGFFL